MKCINTKHPDFLKLIEETNLSPIVLDMKIGKWQEENGSDSFPSAEVLLSTSELNTVMKSVDILQSEKAKQVFAKGEKAGWDLNKILTELQIPKEQKQLILNLGITDREQIALELTSNFSYTVEINTAKHKGAKYYSDGFPEITEINGRYFTISADGDYDSEITKEEYENIKNQEKNSDYYSNLTVPGGINYTENEIATPTITPSIKGHAQFATDNGIGWFRSDEQTEEGTQEKEEYIEYDTEDGETLIPTNKQEYKGGKATKTRRILEIQSDLFQKGRDKDNLLSPFKVSYQEQKGKTAEQVEQDQINKSENQFLQLLNKDNNWVTFFIKSIIQDSAKKGYEKVLFPKGDTAAKIEGHQTLEEFKKEKETRIIKLENEKDRLLAEQEVTGADNSNELLNIDNEILTLEDEIANVESGKTQLSSIARFYEETVTNILKKNGYNPVEITDEYGNKWNEIEIKDSRDLSPIQYSKGLGQPTATQIRRELSIPYKGSELRLASVRGRLDKYNDKNGTSHRLSAISLNQANTEYGFVLELNFNPVNQEAKDARKKARKDPDQYSLFEQSTEDFISKRKISKLTFPEVNGYVESFKDFHNIVMSHILNHPTKYQHEIDPQTNSPAFIIDSVSILRNLARVNQTFKGEIFKIDLAPNGVTPATRMVTINNDTILEIYERRVIEMEESARNEGLENQYDKRLPDTVIEEESLDKTAEKIAKLSAAFPNAEVIMDGDMDENTFGSIQYINGIPTIRLNAKGVKSDTVIHEFGHLFIDSLGGMSNPFIKRGRDLLRGSKIEADVISVYGDELSGEALDKEILTTAVGIEGANLEKMSPFKQWIKIFFNKLKLALGIRGNVALELAQRMLNNEVSSVTRFANLPNYIQYSKVQSEKGPTSLQDRKMNQVINNLLDKVTILKHKYKKSKKNEFKQEIEEILKDLVRAKDTKGIIRYLDEVESLSNQVLNRIENISLDNIDGQLLRNLYTFSGIFDMAAEVEEIVIVSKKELKTDLDKYVEKGLLTISDGVYSISETATPIEENEINTTLGIFLSLQAKTKTINTVNANTVSIKKHYKMLSTEFMVQQMKGNVGRIKGRYREMFEKQFPKRTSSQTKEEYKLAKASFIDNKMKEYDADIEADTENYLRDILASAPKDYNNLEAWVVDPKNLDGTIINFVTKVLEEADYLSDRAYLDEEKTAAEILENYKKFKGSTNNMEELYSDFIEKDSKGNPTGYMVGEFLSSSGEFSGTPNPQYNKIREMRVKDSQHPMVQMYDYLTSISAKKDANLPEAYKLGKSIVTLGGDGDVITSVVYKLPTIEKGSIERISEQGLGTFFMEGLKDIYQRDTSYTESGELLVDDNNKIKSEKTTLNAKKVIVDEAGKERQDIPIHFRAGVRNEGQQSYDLTGILLADYHMSENYKQKSAVRHVAEIALDVVSQNSVTQRTGGILKINALSPNQNPLGISGAQSNVYKTLNSIVQQRLYGISSIDLGDVSIKGKDVSINKILNGIMKWTGDTLLIGNTLSAPVNMIQGKVYNFIEGASGGFFSLSNFKNAEVEYWKDIKNITDDGLGKQVVGSKTNLLIERFGAFNEIANIGKKFSHSNRVIRLFDRGVGHGLNNSIEHYIQGTVIYSVLDSIKVKDINGNEVSLHEAYEVKGNRLVAKEGFSVDLETEAKVSSRIKEVIKQLHGNYDSKNLAMIQRHAGGKMAFMLRKWLIPGVQRRWRGVSTFYKKAEDLEDTDIFYSEFLDQRIEGYYTTSMRYLNQVKGDLFKLQLGLVAAKWNEMTDYEKSNVKKTVMEGALIILTMMASSLLAGLAKDADDEDKEMYYRLAYTFRRLQGETTFYLDPRETLKIMSSPAASISMIKNTSDAAALLFTDPLAKYKIGDRKGEYKLKKKVFKLFPVLSQVDRDVVEVYEWLENI